MTEDKTKDEPWSPVSIGVDVTSAGAYVVGIFALDDDTSQIFYAKHHPAPQRKPLTLEQLREHWKVAKVLDMTDAEIDFADYVLIARDVEALHGIKGEA